MVHVPACSLYVNVRSLLVRCMFLDVGGARCRNTALHTHTVTDADGRKGRVARPDCDSSVDASAAPACVGPPPHST